MRKSNRIYQGVCTAAIALSLVACGDTSTEDYGASSLIDPTETTAEGSGSSGGAKGATSIVANAKTITAVAESTPLATKVNFAVTNDEIEQIYVQLDTGTYNGLSSASVQTTGDFTAELDLIYKTTEDLVAGVYTDSIAVNFCEDAACNSPLDGSPYTVASNLTVNLVSSVGEEPLLLKEEDRKTIDTDLFAATFVKSAGVFVAAVNSTSDELDYPPQTVIFINPETGATGLIGYLSSEAISITSDNTGNTPRVVVGHANGYVTVFDYNETLPSASLNYLLFTGEVLGEVALNGTDVYAIPATGGSDVLRRIDLSTNEYAEHLGSEVPAGSTLSAHADGNSVYVASSAADGLIQHFNVRNGGVNLVGNSAATGVSDLCGGIWSSADNDKLVSGCGDIFSSSEVASSDLLWLGNISQPAANPLKDDQDVLWFSDSVSNSSEMLTLSVSNLCTGIQACPRTLSIYGKNDYSHITSRTFGSYLAANGEPIRLELPVAAAYSADGTKIYVLTRLDESLPRDAEGELVYDVENAYIHVINR